MSLLIFVSLISFGVVLGCRFPPSLWCSSYEIAQECKVAEQCSEWSSKKTQVANPVNFALFLESLCPDCKIYMTKQLFPAWEQIASIVNLTLVPYGNAKETKIGNTWKFVCQHGPQECLGNLIETCAIHVIKDIKIYFPLINCIEASSLSVELALKNCAAKFNITTDEINKCVKSPLGNQLEHEMALQTDALDPPHTFVPWVTLNGVHNDDIQRRAETDTKGLICDAYQGVKPDACKQAEKRFCQQEY